MVVKLENIPTYIINLKRRPDRRRNMQKLVTSLGIKEVHWIPAVDGQELLDAGGRQRSDTGSKGLFKLSWTEDGERQLLPIKLPSSREKGHGNAVWNPWSFLGCNLSHMACWQAIEAKQGCEGFALIMEDDCHLMDEPSKVRSRFRESFQKMLARKPGFAVCYLGGMPLYSGGGSTACGLGPIRKAKRVYQAHAYVLALAHCEDFLAHAKRKMLEQGMLIDNAMVSFQRTPSANNRCFLFDCASPLGLPGVGLIQQGQLGSDLIRDASTQGGKAGWDKAFRKSRGSRKPKLPAKVLRKLGPQKRGVKPIGRRVLKKSAKRRASAGGVRLAGNGSSARAVRAKEQWLQRYKERHGDWPSRRTAWDEKQISMSIWDRVCNAAS